MDFADQATKARNSGKEQSVPDVRERTTRKAIGKGGVCRCTRKHRNSWTSWNDTRTTSDGGIRVKT